MVVPLVVRKVNRMSNIANCKITIQASSREQAEVLVMLLDLYKEYQLFTTGIQDNTREPFKEGVHLSIFYRLPEEEDNDTL